MNAPSHSPRAVWVDAARSLAMLPVLWLHAGAAPGVLSLPVGGALCLFFVLAGYFMPRQAKPCAARAAKLALAWLIWTLLSWGLFCLAAPEREWTWRQVVGWGAPALNTPLWFLRNLAVYQLVFAGMMSLRLLPRYRWLWLALLAGWCYAAGPGQHECLRFDWMGALALGFCLRPLDLEQLRGRLERGALPLLVVFALWFVQWRFYPEWLHAHGLSAKHCSLPLGQAAWALLYLLLALGAQRVLPRLAHLLSLGGTGMIFCYAAHSLLYAPLYAFDIRWAGNFWAPLIVLPLLTLLHRLLLSRLPRLTRLLCAK